MISLHTKIATSLVEIDPVFLQKTIFNFVNVFLLYHYNFPLQKKSVPIWTKLNPLHPRMICATFGWFKISQWFWRRILLNFDNFFVCVFLYYLLLKKGVALRLKNLNLIHPRTLCAKCGWNWPSCSAVFIFKKYFNVPIDISLFFPLKKGGSFIWTKLNSLYPRILCVKFIWNWLSDFGEDFLNFYKVFLPFRNYLSLENWVPFIWTNLNPIQALCQVWLNLYQWFWRRWVAFFE